MISLSAYTLTTQFRPAPKVEPITPPPIDRDLRDALLTRLWATELTAEEIATQCGFPNRDGVYNAVHRLGLPKRKLRSPNRISGAAAHTVIRELWTSNLELKEIAARLGWRHGQSVSKCAKDIGLPNRRTGASRAG